MEQQISVRTKKSRGNRPANPQNRTVILTQNRKPNIFGTNPYGLEPKDIKFVNRNKQTKPWVSQSLTRNKSLAAKGNSKNQSKSLRRSVVFEEDEYVAEVVGGAATNVLDVVRYDVNIGQARTFPWGSGLCKDRFEKYIFEYLEFYYKREVSEFAAGGTSGKVIMAFLSDASAGLPTTKQSLEDTDPHSDAMPSENFRLVIPQHMLKRMNDGFFIRPGRVPAQGDIKTFDIGQLLVATLGLNAPNITVGELHVRYKVRCFIPILEISPQIPQNRNTSVFQGLGQEFGPAQDIVLELVTEVTNGLELVNNDGVIILPKGTYLIDAFCSMYCLAGTSTIDDYVLYVRLNGAAMFHSEYEIAGAASTNATQITLNTPPYCVQSDGTSYISLVIGGSTTFGPGNAAARAQLRITAV
jgi:hypothetical protein